MNYKNQIDPELRQMARNMPYNKPVIKCANIFQNIFFRLTRIPKEVLHRTVTIKGYQDLKFRVEIFEPLDATEKLPCLLYVHGGAFSYKASPLHKKLACLYAIKAKCRVYLPDYHLIPQYPYPAAYKDVLALYKYILENSEELNIDAEKIGVYGESAGASIAALICNQYEQEHLKQPCIQMLVYPVTDADMQTDSIKKFTDTPIWNAKSTQRMWSLYCKNLNTEEAHAASPMHGRLPQIIPDTYIETAEFDCLHDEGVLYGKKLREAGAKVHLNETIGTIHGYDSAINTKIAVQNIEKRILFLKKEFHGGAST